MNIRNVSTYHAGVTQAAFNRKFQRICDEILLPFGITKTQWLIIGTVLDHSPKGIRLNELAAIIDTTKSYLTTTINLLESRGMLERQSDPDDIRSKYIRVAGSYKPTCKKIEETLRKGLREKIYAKVDPEEFVIYLKIMDELASIE